MSNFIVKLQSNELIFYSVGRNVNRIRLKIVFCITEIRYFYATICSSVKFSTDEIVTVIVMFESAEDAIIQTLPSFCVCVYI